MSGVKATECKQCSSISETTTHTFPNAGKNPIYYYTVHSTLAINHRIQKAKANFQFHFAVSFIKIIPIIDTSNDNSDPSQAITSKWLKLGRHRQ